MALTISGIAQLQRRLRALQKVPRPILATIQLDTVRIAKQNITAAGHVQTGHTRRTIRKGYLTHDAAAVLAGGAAVYIEKGTRPHRIPKSGNARRPMPLGGPRRLSGAIRSGGRPAGFAWHVQHPGTKADPFLVPAAKQALADSGWQDEPAKAWDGAA